MPLTLVGHGTATRPIHRDGALPASTQVPSRRETLEALEIVTRLAPERNKSVLIDNKVITHGQALEILRRFILTR